jgi:POT family proton-dependent oligopeptide transporter
MTTATGERTVLGHPPALFMLFFAEAWERFSFYGMRALLELYMIKQLVFGDERAHEVYGAYGTLVYATPVIGGLLADRVLGYRRAILFGGVLMAIGHFAMAIENEVFLFVALSFLILGNGFFKPNISSIVGQLYPPGDLRRDNAFTIFYMGINLGAGFAPLVCGVLGEAISWSLGFGLAGAGMLVGLSIFGALQHLLGPTIGLPPEERPRPGGIDGGWLVVVGAILAVPGTWWLVQQHAILGYLLSGLGIVVLIGLLVTAFTSEATERDRLLVVIILVFFSIVFWAFFEQAGSSINLFTDRNVDRGLPAVVDRWWQGLIGAVGSDIAAVLPANLKAIPTSSFQAVNPAFIVLLGPVFTTIWAALRARGMEPSTPMKFALGIAQLGLGFAILALAAVYSTNGISPLWILLLGYLLHTTGELCTSPVGLSMVTKLAPQRIVGLVMGTWFLSSAFAHYIASMIAKLTSATPADFDETAHAAMQPIQTLPLYTDVFQQIAIVAIVAAAICAALIPLLKRWMHGVN